MKTHADNALEFPSSFSQKKVELSGHAEKATSKIISPPQSQKNGKQNWASAIRFQPRAFMRARLLVRCYYACGLYFALALMPDWAGLLERNMPDPLWPVAWLAHVPLRAGIAAILVLYLLGSMGAAIWPQKRWARTIGFLGLFQWVAFNNSFGKIGHSMHLWVLTSAALIFLPQAEAWGGSPTRAQRQKFLLIFWGCQAAVMLVYSMSGLGKVLGAIYQLCTGQTQAFMPGALATVVAERLLETNSRSLLGPWLIEHPSAGWPLMVANIYLQLFAFPAVFRPSLHRVWGIGLILFHIGSFLLLTISFPQNALLLALFFVNSPFRRENENWRQTLADLPLLGRFFPRRCAS
ncbi:MAG TPA: hypothetical protein VG754_00475 [Verrucomicrobiae bacterium]|nr:hypothetical protein [Verrucomicrobiae bacterium]